MSIRRITVDGGEKLREVPPLARHQQLIFVLGIITIIGMELYAKAALAPQRTLHSAKEVTERAAHILMGLCKYQSTELNFNGTALTFFPRELCQLTRVTALKLFCSQIPSIPSEIGQLSNLNLLVLSNNSLSSIPAEICRLSKLQILDLEGNKLMALPTGISQLSSLEELKLSHNRLSSLPEQILTMRSDLKIGIDFNPISLRVIQNLRQLMNPPYNGPRISYSIPREGEDRRSLNALRTELAQAIEQPPCPFIKLAPHAEKVRKWLARLSAIGDYKKKRQEFALLIHQTIVLAEAEPEFLDTFLSCIDEADTTCGDRMALSLLRMDILYKIAKSAKEGNLKELAYLLGHGSWALSELEVIARNKVPTLKLVDEIEVYLAYPIMLKDALKMPLVLDSMLYFVCSSVTAEDLTNAETLVKGFLSNRESYFDYLAKNVTWQKALKEHLKEEYTILNAKRESADSAEFIAGMVKLTQKTLEEVGMPPFLDVQQVNN